MFCFVFKGLSWTVANSHMKLGKIGAGYCTVAQVMVYKHQTDKVKQYVVVVRWFTHGPWMDGLKSYTEKCSKLLH